MLKYKTVWVLIGISTVVVISLIGYFHSNRHARKHVEYQLSGRMVYETYCKSCHGNDGRGGKRYPSLVKSDLSLHQFSELVEQGDGTMPSFSETLFESDYEPLYRYILTLKEKR